jgi:hypothetical protein
VSLRCREEAKAKEKDWNIIIQLQAIPHIVPNRKLIVLEIKT